MKLRLGPGTPAAGFLIAACLALLAHARVLACATPIWDDAVFLLRDERVRSLAGVVTAFGDSFFGPHAPNEMYRPVVNASLAFDWWFSGSTPGDVHLLWFHLVNLLLHAANAGLAYLFLANLTARKLGAPLLAACLFAVHPLAVEPTAWIVGRCDLLATFFGLLSGICLLRVPARRALLVPALLAYTLALFAKASAAPLPVAVALGIVAYRGMPPAQLFGRRVLARFLPFLVPLGVWIGARALVLGAPFPRAGGVVWHDVPALAAARGVGRAVAILASHIVLPVGLCGDYRADAAWDPAEGGLGPHAVAGLALLLFCGFYGLTRLRARPRVAYPLLAFALLLVPVLQVVPIGAIVAERFAYLPMLFALLLVGEGLERAFETGPRPAVLATTFALFLLLGVQSQLRAAVWQDPVAFERDVLASYPGAREPTQRLALALSDRGEGDEALRLLRSSAARQRRPDWEWHQIGAILLEQGDLTAAEPALRRALELSQRDAQLGAKVRYNLAVLLHRTGRDDEARAFLDEALARAPHLAPARALREKLTPR